MAVVVQSRPKLSIKLPETEDTANGYSSNASPKASSANATPSHAAPSSQLPTPELRNRMGVNSPRLPHRPDSDSPDAAASSSPPKANGATKVLPPLPVGGSQKRIGSPPRVTLTKTQSSATLKAKANGHRNTKSRPKKEATLQLAKANVNTTSSTSSGKPRPPSVVVKAVTTAVPANTNGSISTGTGIVATANGGGGPPKVVASVNSSRSFANSPRVPHKVDHQAPATPVSGPKRPTLPKPPKNQQQQAQHHTLPQTHQPPPSQLATQVPRPKTLPAGAQTQQQHQYAPPPPAQQNGAHQQQQASPYASNNDAGGLSGLVTQVSRDPQPPSTPPQRPLPRGPLTQPRRTKTYSTQDEDDVAPVKPKRRKGGKLRALSRRLCSCMMIERPSHLKTHSLQNDGAVYEIDPQVDDDGTSDEEELSESGGLLGPKHPENTKKKTLVLDLDETLVHSSFKPVPNPDFIVPITIERTVHRVYVMKRPGVDEFLQKVCQKFEVVVFTASLAKYANPLLNVLDPNNTIAARLFREACVLNMGIYVKDLAVLGRKLADTIIVDNSPPSYAFHPQNAIPIESWFDDRLDRQLYDLLPVLINHIADVKDVREHLDASKPISWLLQDAQERGVIDRKNQMRD